MSDSIQSKLNYEFYIKCLTQTTVTDLFDIDAFFDVEHGRRDDFACTRDGRVETPPSSHHLTCYESQDQHKCHRVG